MRARWVALACLSACVPGWIEARTLSFEDRVRAQEAIERVRYAHQTGATEPFEAAVSEDLLETKVRRYLEQSAALDSKWRTPVTAEMLRREMERMASASRMADRLSELYAAVGNDPFLVAECIARPALVERTSRSFFAGDESIHRVARGEAESLRADLVRHGVDGTRGDRRRTDLTYVRVTSEDVSNAERVRVLPLEPGAFDRLRARMPARVGEIGPVRNERDAFVIEVVLDEASDHVRIARFAVAKKSWSSFWNEARASLDVSSVRAVTNSIDVIPASAPTNAAGDTWINGSLDDVPDAREGAVAVWTGTEMIVWGGEPQGNANLDSGGAYDPATDTWRLIATAGAPEGREGVSVVWTGKEMIAWGGRRFVQFPVATGGRYDPITDTWTPISTSGAPSARKGHTAVWTGAEMIVWGGTTDTTGGRYDPALDRWTPVSTYAAPTPRSEHVAIWTGERMVVWGGTTDGTGGRYDPVSDTWLGTSLLDVPGPRFGATAVWTGSEMITWGGRASFSDCCPQGGGRYDPIADKWTPTATFDAPWGRSGHTAVWTGTEMIVWGWSPGFPLGARYDPAGDTWTSISSQGAPPGTTYHAGVWTGTHLIVWAGDGSETCGGITNTGGRYDPATDSWTPVKSAVVGGGLHRTAVWTGNEMLLFGGWTSEQDARGFRYDPVLGTWTLMETLGQPSMRLEHTAIWTGREMIVWGGTGDGYRLRTGARYDPLHDRWRSVEHRSSPHARSGHAAVWTGNKMIVWSGNVSPRRSKSGSVYDPSTNTWAAMSVDGAPIGRVRFTAVWTGSKMIVWGGYPTFVGESSLDSGGSYDPVADRWTETSIVGAPEPRHDHTAVWTGTRMIVWGGTHYTLSGHVFQSTGSSYDPELDTWQAISDVDAPTARIGHTAIWTGSEMIVWGGKSLDATNFGTGARYDSFLDVWTATPLLDAPSPRYGHTAVWTGTGMIVWGGDGGPTTGGQYFPSSP